MWLRRLFRPIGIASLVAFRIAFGAIMTWEAMRYLVPRERGGVCWARQFYIQPRLLFKYYGFEWVHPWPGDGMIWHFWAMALAAACVAFGAFYRAAAVALFALISHVFLLDQARYLNHVYLICLLSFLIIFLPLNRAASVDAWLRPAIRRDVVPGWTLWLLRFQLGIVYIFSGIARINGDWLRGEPMRTWLAERAAGTRAEPLLVNDWAPYVFSYGGMLFDLLIVPLLLWRRTRPVAFCVAVLFHLANAYLFHIGVFPWLAIAATTLFLDPDWPRRALRRLPRVTVTGAPSTFPVRRGVVVVLAVYALVQLLVPLRHWLYPGDVKWTQEGHHFSWRMRLDERRVKLRMDVIDPATGTPREVDCERFLSAKQLGGVAARPDMLVQFARHVSDHYRKEFGTREPPAVHATVEMSVNGRPMMTLIDPAVNLATRRVSLAPADWIVRQELPPLESHGANARRGGQ